MKGAIYLASSGAMLNQRRLEILSNNLANITTTGFKRQTTAFQIIDSPEDMRQALASFSLGATSPAAPIWQRMDTRIDFSQGRMRKTGNPLDLALSGKGFFSIQTPEGVRYTRKGNFVLNADKELTTADGHAVLSERGPIRIDGSHVMVDEQGNLTVDGQPSGQLRIVAFDNDRNFQRLGGTLLSPPNGVDGGKRAEEVQVRQGYLESSNVEAVKTMVEMIDALRSYEAYQKTIRTLQETSSKAINEVGRVG